MPALNEYKRKRNFHASPEPQGKKHSHSSHIYVIQKHAARRLHYDLRLEWDGALKSWAVPKGPSLDPSIKRLAVHVEDHPIEYADFEGNIPKGNYGAGSVIVWDNGTWEPQDDNIRSAYKKGKITFLINGKKLKGLWKLIRIQADPKNWLLMKVKDKYSKSNFEITDKQKLSVKTHHSIEKVAKLTSSIEKHSPFPDKISPQLATLAQMPPDSEEWLHEVKLDGYRFICFINHDNIRLVTRNYNDWTYKFPAIVKALKNLKLKNVILDGELVALDKHSLSNFQLLQNSIDENKEKDLVYYIFDILYHEGKSLFDMPLLKRKALLEKLLKNNNSKKIRYSDHVTGNGIEVYQKACSLGLEGIISKKVDSFYTQQRTRNWLKLKCQKQQEFVIGGYTDPNGNRRHFGSLLIGYYDKKHKLQYCGHVGTGFTDESLKKLYTIMRKHIIPYPPFAPNPLVDKQAHWIEPVLVCIVEFSEWTQDKILRHPSFKGLRKDKPPQKVTLETPKMNKSSPHSSLPKLTHPDKILFPNTQTTKLDLANYYLSIQKLILPHIINRPLSFVRCPQGQNNKCFYQKHLTEIENNHLYKIDIKESNTTRSYTYIKDIEGLLALVQLNILEIHCWNCNVKNVDCPDRIIFDLDPAPEVPWPKVVKAAFFIRDQLDSLQLKSFVKTTGGKGLHIVVPIQPKYIWDAIKDFAGTFVHFLVDKKPSEFVGTMSKEKRKGKIFIDYFRNNRGATSIAPYSTRTKDKPTVATPLSWDELTSRIKPDQFTISNFQSRLKKDPWKDLPSTKQSLNLKYLKNFFK